MWVYVTMDALSTVRRGPKLNLCTSMWFEQSLHHVACLVEMSFPLPRRAKQNIADWCNLPFRPPHREDLGPLGQLGDACSPSGSKGPWRSSICELSVNSSVFC